MLIDYHGEYSRDRDDSQICDIRISYDLYNYSLMAFGSNSTKIFTAPQVNLCNDDILIKCQVLMSAFLTIEVAADF